MMGVSVIIPTLNEESCIAETIRQLRLQEPYEIIVVDGGSTDATEEQAAQADMFLHGGGGRAGQMNLGARNATGDVLVFLHADCLLEEGSLADARQILERSNVAAACFTMRVSADGLLYRSIDYCATARVRLSGLIYGDQGFCIRRDLFERLEGFPPVKLMEDVYISRKLRRHGRVVVIPRQILVSPRRWQKVGLIRQTLRNWALTALAAGGVSPDSLARFYPAVR
jgi:rSAM/selenodomain-associated transferase 2